MNNVVGKHDLKKGEKVSSLMYEQATVEINLISSSHNTPREDSKQEHLLHMLSSFNV